MESGGGLSLGDLLEKPEDMFDFEPNNGVEVPVVLDVTDVLLSPLLLWSLRFVMGFSCRSEWECVEPQPFSFSKKGAHCCTVTQEEMKYESSQVKAPPLSSRRRAPTQLQNSNFSSGEEQGRFEAENQMWSTRERTIIARTKQYMEVRKSIKVDIEELETLLGADDIDVDFRRILEEARDEKRCAIF